MTTQKSFSETRRPYFSPSFFRGVMRRAWPKLLCYSLVLFFILPLPILFSINERRAKTASVLIEMLDRMLTRNLWTYCLFAAALGVFGGILATRYLNRRASVDYYHSLPLRREGLLITHWLEGALHFTAALAIDLVLSVAVIATVMGSGAGFGPVLGKLALDVGYMLMSFLLFYTLTVFCGMLCGTSVMQVVVTGLSLGAYPLWRLLMIAFGEEFVSRIDIYAMTEGGWRFLSPMLRLFYLSGSDTVYGEARNSYLWEYPFLWWEILLWIAATVGLFFAALCLYRHRHVERAGTPVVFGGVAEAVRWVVVLLGTMGLGWLFQALGQGIFWLFFGFLLGGFLAFILVGTLLTKNPKQMFEGWRRLIVCLLLFCLLFVGSAFAAAAVDRWVPSHVDRIALSFDGESYGVTYYEDPAVIAAWQALEAQSSTDYRSMGYLQQIVEEEEYWEYYATGTESLGRNYYFNKSTVSMRARVKVGPLVIPYVTRQYLRSELEDVFRAVTASAEFEAGWDALMAEVATHEVLRHDPTVKDTQRLEMRPIDAAQLSMHRLFAEIYGERVGMDADDMATSDYNRNDILAPTGEETAEAVLADFEDVDFDFFQSPVYGLMTVPGLSRVSHDRGMPREDIFFLYLPMSAPALYREVLGLDEAAFYEAMADRVLAERGGLYVAKRVRYAFSLEDAQVIKVTDRGQIVEVLRGMSALDFGDGYQTEPHFTVYDEDYGIVFPDGRSDRVIRFIKGKVPAFVQATLG
ncbi:MAG: hypothetical protein IJW99_11305 [Clostridia bacterium]|nr:hypothetical protein [Clostridia bacterium]